MHEHKKYFGIGLAVLGILFLLQDLGKWDFWSISWYTALFLLVGIKIVVHSFLCKGDCCGPAKKNGKKK